MSDPSLELQGAIVRALKASADLQGVVGTRVYDSVPASPTFPYVTVGDGQVLPDAYDGVDGKECFLMVHTWSREPGFPQTKAMTGPIIDALDGAELGLGVHRLVDLLFERMDFLNDPDGLTRHAAITFRALTEPA
jgi:hypothetical protein